MLDVALIPAATGVDDVTVLLHVRYNCREVRDTVIVDAVLLMLLIAQSSRCPPLI